MIFLLIVLPEHPAGLECNCRMLAGGAPRQLVVEVIGGGVKAIYKYFPVQRDDKKNPLEQAPPRGKYFITLLLCATLRTDHLLGKFLGYRDIFNR
ncbi:TPA: hypothetical protein JD037_16335 [Raoultella ornithinolytica]|nr:hypothetical protein [Raoultella ornithinolytica]